MKKIFVSEIKERDKVNTPFLCTKKTLAVGKTGKPYLNLGLMDKTGEIDGRVWDDAEAIASRFEVDQVVVVRGHATVYQGKVQLNVTSVQEAEGSASLRDLMPASKEDPEKMISELDAIVDEVRDPYIKKLLLSVLGDREIRTKFMECPAAKGMHHPYLGGLLEHVLSLCKLGTFVSTHYEGVNTDLVTAGLILHDIGKIYELYYGRSFGYTDEGRLIGHITLGLDLVDKKIREIDGFPEKLKLMLRHIMLSHHGLLEYGSPKRPKTLEAVIVSFLDDLDAKVNAVTALKEGSNGEDWSPFQRMFERYIYTGSSFDDDADTGDTPAVSEAAPASDTPDETLPEDASKAAAELELFPSKDK